MIFTPYEVEPDDDCCYKCGSMDVKLTATHETSALEDDPEFDLREGGEINLRGICEYNSCGHKEENYLIRNM